MSTARENWIWFWHTLRDGRLVGQFWVVAGITSKPQLGIASGCRA
jgi:hypothetical protein